MLISKELPVDHGLRVEAHSHLVTSSRSARVASIDIFRGLTMVVMVFVNQLGEMKGMPWWTVHMPANINAMTYVDMVFPFFLFIVGMSLPLSVQHRLSKGDSELSMWAHVVFRSVGLMVLGLVLANRENVDAQLTHIAQNIWTLLALLGAILFWISYPHSLRYKKLFRTLKISGLVLLVVMLAIFRRLTPEGHVAWLDTSYWEILGIIGWTYLSVCILYIPTRRWRWMQVAWFIALSVMNIFSAAHWIAFTKLPNYIWPFKSGAGQSIMMAGLIASLLFLTDAFTSNRRQKTIWALSFAAALFSCRMASDPAWHFQGASHSNLVPGLLSSSHLRIPCSLLGLRRAKASALGSARKTSRIQYAPDLSASALMRRHLWQGGSDSTMELRMAGRFQAVAFTAGIVAISAILTRLKVRMQL